MHSKWLVSRSLHEKNVCLKFVKEEVVMEPSLEDAKLWAQLGLADTLHNVWETQIHWAREIEKQGQNPRKVSSQPNGIYAFILK